MRGYVYMCNPIIHTHKRTDRHTEPGGLHLAVVAIDCKSEAIGNNDPRDVCWVSNKIANTRTKLFISCRDH